MKKQWLVCKYTFPNGKYEGQSLPVYNLTNVYNSNKNTERGRA